MEFRITTNFRILICLFQQHNESEYTFTMSFPQLCKNYQTTKSLMGKEMDETEKQTVHFYCQLFETCLRIEPQSDELYFNFICQNGKLVTNYFYR